MPYETRPNTGSLWENKKKRPDSNDADRTGSINVDGVDYWINGWLKRTKTGERFLSLSVKPKQKRDSDDPPEPKQQPLPSDNGFQPPF